MTRPILLDLFCGAGGAARGYYDAGFDVIGVDVQNMPRYPYTFYRGDVFDLAPKLLTMRNVVAVHASPPCQRYSSLTPNRFKEDCADLVEPTRALLESTGLPWIMENVPNSPLVNATLLCGTTFGLGAEVNGVWHELPRHRFFESNVPLHNNGPCRHSGAPSIGVYGKPGGTSTRGNLVMPGAAHWSAAMGIDWMDSRVITQAIPPVYSQFLGAQLMEMHSWV